MDRKEAGAYWERNAEAWTQLVRRGWDVYRDLVNTPAFLEMLPEVRGLTGLDIGCGEGHNRRLIAARGARMFALDVSQTFARHAAEASTADLAIRHVVADAVRLPFAAERFDFATALMSLMDLPEQELAFEEIFHILRPGGFLQFSIIHPCFNTPHRRLLRGSDGLAYAVEVGRYFDQEDGRI